MSRPLSGSIFLILCMWISATESVSPYIGYQVWRVNPSRKEQLIQLASLGEDAELDFWNEPISVGRAVTFMVPPNLKIYLGTKLQDFDLGDYAVDIEDVQTVIDHQLRSIDKRSVATKDPLTVANFDYSVYHRPSEVYDWMDMVVKEFNETTTKVQYGVSYEGRPLYALQFTRNTSQLRRPKIFIDALIHCREWITTASVLFMFKEMLINPKYFHMMEDVDWVFVPMVNVDGYEETWNGYRLWRKTKSTGASRNCVGIDGNRNWNAFWATVPGASPNPCSNIYYGPTPESETEVRHLANYVLGFDEGTIDAYISTHSAAQMILYPYIYSISSISADDAALHETGKLMSDAVRAVHNKTYVYGRGSVTIYPASGSTTDWTYEKAKIVQSHTYELRDTGEYGHLLPADQIIPNGEEYLEGIRAMKDYVFARFSG